MFATRFLNLDHLAYIEALELMRGLVEAKKKEGSRPEILMMLEHEPVLTMGRRSQETDIRVSRACLQERGIAVHRIERGGLITYHGPGQLVAYVIFNLKRMRLGVGELVHGLEGVVLDTLSDYDIGADRLAGYRGVWAGGEKIASIGIAVRRSITFHGVALNYNPDLTHFEMISPCGLPDVRMTSMSKILQTPVQPEHLRQTMARHFRKHFHLELQPWTMQQVRTLLNSGDGGRNDSEHSF